MMAERLFPSAAAPMVTPSAPTAEMPSQSCDTHVHMVASPSEFQLWKGRTEDPAPGTFDQWIGRLRRHLETLRMSRVVIVHSILFGGDNSVTVEAVRSFGTGRARGIGLVADDVKDAELDALAASGFAGIRLNYVHGGILTWNGVKRMAPRLAARGMHVHMLMNAHRHLFEISDDVRQMPVPVVFDHIGWPDIHAGIHEAGFSQLCRLVADGDAYVKLSGVYRLCPAPYDYVADHVAALVRSNPERCLWGSDWPHLMLADADMPDAGSLLNAFLDVVTSGSARKAILSGNPAQLFGFLPG